jgi:glutaredoxin
LESHNIEYTEVNVTGNPQASAQLEEWTGGYRTTPTFDIDGTILVDFDEAKVSEVLKDRLGIQIQG